MVVASGVIILIDLTVGLSLGLKQQQTLPAATTNAQGLYSVPVSSSLLSTFRSRLSQAFRDAIDDALEGGSTPQGKAFDWLQQHSELLVRDESDALLHLTQWFALASFNTPWEAATERRRQAS
jgi:hypothetical protein